MMQKCSWCLADPLLVAYHDEEWGVPVKDPLKLFEMIVLESMQAGLNWFTVLKKREAMRHAFFHFIPERLAQLNDKDFAVLLNNESIIRNRLKIKSLQTNAKSFLQIADRENVVDYFWQFSKGKVLQTNRKSMAEIPGFTEESTAMAKELKKEGFVFMGPTTCYALMQAIGMVNDHLQCCFRHKELVRPEEAQSAV